MFPHLSSRPLRWQTALRHFGCALLALTLGHLVMALAHAYLWREDTLTRMLRGRPASIGGAK